MVFLLILVVRLLLTGICCSQGRAAGATSSFQRGPSISYITKSDATVRIGGMIEMDCSVQHSTEYPVLWMKLPPTEGCGEERKRRRRRNNDCTPTPLSSGSALVVSDDRFRLRYDTASSTYSLQLSDIKPSDEAVYECQVIVALNQKITRSVRLRVTRPPVIVAANSSRDVVVVQENEPVELFCSAGGSPPPSVTWKRKRNDNGGGGSLSRLGGVFRIDSVKREDRGPYYCEADNGVGEPARHGVTLQVEYSPTVSVTPPRFSTASAALEMSCKVESFPPPTAVTWTHHGAQLVTDETYTVKDTVLDIKSVGPAELGKYFCRARNKIGSAEGVAEVVKPGVQPQVSGGVRKWSWPMMMLMSAMLMATAAQLANALPL